MSIDIDDARVRLLLTSLGTPYCWGAGNLRDTKDCDPAVGVWRDDQRGRGFDCSGHAQWALLALNMVRPNAWHDIAAHDLANACESVDPIDARVGDLYFYKPSGRDRINHVTVALGGGMCLSARGGSDDYGDNPSRCIEVRHYHYRGDFLVCGRLKAEFAP